MPRYYQYGYQGPPYVYNWQGVAARAHQAAELRSLGDVTKREFMTVPRRDSPYWLHKQYDQRPAEFFVPRRDSPYWLHKHPRVGSRWGGPRGGGPRGGLGNADRPYQVEGLVYVGLGLAALYLLRRKKK